MVSIIIPVYNVENYLNICVESALKLKTDVELVLVDDGSTDGSGALCDAWAEKDSCIRVIHQENGGLSAARNTGIRNARGSHVLFLDSDDFLDSDATDRMLSQLTDATDVLLGLYNNYYTEDDRYEKESCDAFLSLEGSVGIDTFLSAIPAHGQDCYMVAVRFICRREFLLENDLLFFPGIYHEDEDWTARMLCRVEHILVTHCWFYQYRQARAGAITATVKPKRIFDVFTIIGRVDGLRLQQAEGSCRREYLHRKMAGLYLNNMICQHTLRGEDRRAGLEALRRHRSVCAPKMTGRIGKAVRLSQCLLGTAITCWLLGLVRRVLRRH